MYVTLTVKIACLLPFPLHTCNGLFYSKSDWSVRQVVFLRPALQSAFTPSCSFYDMTCGSNFCFFMCISVGCHLALLKRDQKKNEGCCFPALPAPCMAKQECNWMTLCQKDQKEFSNLRGKNLLALKRNPNIPPKKKKKKRL